MAQGIDKHVPVGWEGAVNGTPLAANGTEGTVATRLGVHMTVDISSPLHASPQPPRVSSSQSSASLSVSTSSSLGKRTQEEFFSGQSPTANGDTPPTQRARRNSISEGEEVELELLEDVSPSSTNASGAGSAKQRTPTSATTTAAPSSAQTAGEVTSSPVKGVTVVKGKTVAEDVWVIDSDTDEGDTTVPAPAPAPSWIAPPPLLPIPPADVASPTPPASTSRPASQPQSQRGIVDLDLTVSDDDSLPDDPMMDYTPKPKQPIRKPARAKKTVISAFRSSPSPPPSSSVKRQTPSDADSDVVILDDLPLRPSNGIHFQTPEAEVVSSPLASRKLGGSQKPGVLRRVRIPIRWVEGPEGTAPKTGSPTPSTHSLSSASQRSTSLRSLITSKPVTIGSYVPAGRPPPNQSLSSSQAPRPSIHKLSTTAAHIPSTNGSSSQPKSQPQPQPRTVISTLKASLSISRTQPEPTAPAPSQGQVYGRIPRPQGARATMQAQWDAEVQKMRAAKVFIVGHTYSDRTSVPNVGSNFTYLESEYFYSVQTVLQNPHTRFLPSAFDHVCWQEGEPCTIKPPTRGKRHECTKQQKSYKGQFAYDEQGLFTFQFPSHVVVQECNRYCCCDKDSCQFSVAQRRRKRVMEVFETEACGWGVRTAEDLRRGEVLGMYMGEFITREEAGRRRGNYVFDLDAEEKRDDLSVEGKFSVDAEFCGNWTRFINNSCDPNLIVRTVNYEAPAKHHPGRLMFICDRDIEAGEELSFTYTPTHAVAPEDIDMKPRCRCGADNCRGWY